jgi:hypothetical protein
MDTHSGFQNPLMDVPVSEMGIHLALVRKYCVACGTWQDKPVIENRIAPFGNDVECRTEGSDYMGTCFAKRIIIYNRMSDKWNVNG